MNFRTNSLVGGWSIRQARRDEIRCLLPVTAIPDFAGGLGEAVSGNQRVAVFCCADAAAKAYPIFCSGSEIR